MSASITPSYSDPLSTGRIGHLAMSKLTTLTCSYIQFVHQRNAWPELSWALLTSVELFFVGPSLGLLHAWLWWHFFLSYNYLCLQNYKMLIATQERLSLSTKICILSTITLKGDVSRRLILPQAHLAWWGLKERFPVLCHEYLGCFAHWVIEKLFRLISMYLVLKEKKTVVKTLKDGKHLLK